MALRPAEFQRDVLAFLITGFGESFAECGYLLRSRSGRDVTANFPELASLTELAPDVLLDGEVVLLEHGVPSFHALADRMQTPHPSPSRPVTYMAFDVLRLYGVPLLSRSFVERRATLERLDTVAVANLALSPTYTDGPALFDCGPSTTLPRH